MKWFKHDSTASIDAKLQQILLDYGAAGYGLYWYCVEIMVFGADKKQEKFYLKHQSQVIAKNLSANIEYINEMLSYFVGNGIFNKDENGIFILKSIITQQLTRRSVAKVAVER